MDRPVALAVLAVILASIHQGLVGVFVKWIPWPPLALTCGRCLVAAVFLWLVWGLRRARGAKQVNFSDRGKKTVLLSGAFLAAHWATLFYGYRLSNVAPVIVAVFTFPIIASLVEPFAFSARPSPRDVAWAVLSAVGVGTMVWQGFFGPEQSKLVVGVGFGLVSALFFAARGIASRKLLSEADPFSIMAVQVTVVACLFSPALLSVPSESITVSKLGLVLFLGIGLTAIPHTIFVWAFQRMSVARSGVIASLEVVSGILLATLILGEENPASVWFGAAVVVAAVIAQSRASLRATETAKRE